LNINRSEIEIYSTPPLLNSQNSGVKDEVATPFAQELIGEARDRVATHTLLGSGGWLSQ
jgi:hypothetical protein